MLINPFHQTQCFGNAFCPDTEITFDCRQLFLYKHWCFKNQNPFRRRGSANKVLESKSLLAETPPGRNCGFKILVLIVFD